VATLAIPGSVRSLASGRACAPEVVATPYPKFQKTIPVDAGKAINDTVDESPLSPCPLAHAASGERP
jgi:hypothetical protein